MKPLPLNTGSRSSAGTNFCSSLPRQNFCPCMSPCAMPVSSLNESSCSVFHYCCALNMLGLLYITFSSIDLYRAKPVNVLNGSVYFLAAWFGEVFSTLVLAGLRTCRWIQPWKVNFHDSASLDSLAWILLIKSFLICLQLLHLIPGNSFHCMM